MKTFRYINNDNGSLITEGKALDQVPKRGEFISPFKTPKGRVVWEVKYVEDIDIYHTFVYVEDKGFYTE